MNRVVAKYLKKQYCRKLYVHCSSQDEEPQGPSDKNQKCAGLFAELLETEFENSAMTCDMVRDWRDQEFGGNIVHFLAVQNDLSGMNYAVNLCGADPYLQRLVDHATPLHLVQRNLSCQLAADYLKHLPGYQQNVFKDIEGKTVADYRKQAEEDTVKTGEFLVVDVRATSTQKPLEIACVVLDGQMQQVAAISRCFFFVETQDLDSREINALTKNRTLEDCAKPSTFNSKAEIQTQLNAFLRNHFTSADNKTKQLQCTLLSWETSRVLKFLSVHLPNTWSLVNEDTISVPSLRKLLTAAQVALPPEEFKLFSHSRALSNCLLAADYFRLMLRTVWKAACSGSEVTDAQLIRTGVRRLETGGRWRSVLEDGANRKSRSLKDRPCYIC
jgi:hypothetical protein